MAILDPPRFIGASLAVGLAFAVLDGVLNANPLAQAAYAVFEPIARPALNLFAGIGIDLAYGFALCAIFVVLQPALPGQTSLLQGLSFGVLVWFFRVLMNAAGQWMLFDIPSMTVLYSLGAGLLEMLLLGIMLALLLPAAGGAHR